uniref:Serpin domain-containing protein n=2 Tax=Anopheles atroparvus TaxID=41427 RepID=A0AAG5DFC3_ANOAO
MLPVRSIQSRRSEPNFGQNSNHKSSRASSRQKLVLRTVKTLSEMRSGYVASWMLVVVVVMLATMQTVSAASGQANGMKKVIQAKQDPLDRLQANPASVNQVSDSVTNLAQKIARSIASPKSKTEIFSPVSIAGALSLLLLGAGGQTQRELLNVMGFGEGTAKLSFQEIHYAFGRLFQDLVANDPSLVPLVTWRVNDKCNRYDEDYEDDDFPPANTTANTKDLEIQVGNAIFAKEGTEFDARYNKLARDLYKSELRQLDFDGNEAAAVRTINNWVNNETHGRIVDIVSHISPDTIMMIVNTLYFRGIWEEPFQPMATRNRPFFPDGPDAGGSIDVPMMAKSGCMPYYFWEKENLRVLGVPYKQNATMYILMPMNSTRKLVVEAQSKIDAATLNDLISKMKMKSVTLLMPKMHVTNSLSLKSVLEQLGAVSLFQRETAELSRLLSSRIGDEDIDGPLDDIFSALEDTVENAERKLKDRIPNCLVYKHQGVGRSACLMKNECEWGASTCVCCVKQDADDDFRRRRREANTIMQKAPIYVNEMLHKVDLTVNEVGTEGGAATATLIDRISSQVNFVVNGPFLMVIREETTRLPLFYGTVYTPK